MAEADKFMAGIKELAKAKEQGELTEDQYRRGISILLAENNNCGRAPVAALTRSAMVKERRSSLKMKKLGTILQREVENLHENFDLGKKLGEGQYGITHLCTHKETGEVLACKSISKRKKIITQRDAEVVRREIAMMYHLQGHCHIVNLATAYEDKEDVHLVMEICSGGELFDRIVAAGKYTEQKAARTFRTIMQVVAQCHALGVVHRDLKPENFLLADETEEALLKITDFGLALFYTPGQKFHDIAGTPYYIAPEVLNKDYGPECDVWSAGVILYILLCGIPPFWASSNKGIFDKVRKGEYDMTKSPWPTISDQAKDCVSRLLVVDPTKRMTAQQALEHPWVRENGEAPDLPLDDTVLNRLKKFSTMSYLKKMALISIARNMSSHEIEGLQVLFKTFDTDNSGTITLDELNEGIKKMGNSVTEAEVESVMKSVDIDGDGNISYEEFIAATLNLNKVNSEERLWRAFESFDTDGSGYITPDELSNALSSYNISADKIKEIMAEVDQDNDGRIDYGEFVYMMHFHWGGELDFANM